MLKALDDNKSPSPIALYLDRFPRPDISYEDMLDSRGSKIVYIDTDRFTAKSLYSPKKTYDEYSETIQQLYEVTFADPKVMEKFAQGTTRTQE
ncbi:hypothetical protein phytr_8070 [Candidatus Phycorickettsia trachydisci]|uniref:Uncharacterized protein n=1 Tax=Candidatus Phycorickettsia trachydisci TaxID=2115978 RepID=A0A2P1P8Z1_9RICK|nr:hypothetical protein [Candidatus Phycorickettsia trachydisci]AVP87740.1 hypothetical protein phytr_8070 [Candidatus Phycorickettsia trachydisci]